MNCGLTGKTCWKQVGDRRCLWYGGLTPVAANELRPDRQNLLEAGLGWAVFVVWRIGNHRRK